jgi:hypothetical protein
LSKEVFRIVLEPVFQEDQEPMMPKEPDFAIGDFQSYSNWQSEREKENARQQIKIAAEKAKNPANYPGSSGYCNLNAIENGVGVSMSSRSVEELKRKRLG